MQMNMRKLLLIQEKIVQKNYILLKQHTLKFGKKARMSIFSSQLKFLEYKDLDRMTSISEEIIICDDCSTDNTVQKAESILSHWNGSNKILKNEHNLGFKKNFQKAISLCHGDIIFLSDQDDVWNLEKIEIMMQEFQNVH